jgi:hypothetical protein
MNDDREEKSPNDDHLNRVIDVWKHVVSVQMHFNDIEMRIRNLYFTVLAAALGLIGVVQGKSVLVTSIKLSVQLSMVVCIGIIPISMLFYFIDRHWYHRLLQGSVTQAILIETKYKDVLPEIQLGSQIRDQSPVEFRAWIWKILFFFIHDEKFRVQSRVHSDAKIEILYKSVIWGSALVIFCYAVLGGITLNNCGPLGIIFDRSCRITTTISEGSKAVLPTRPEFPLFPTWEN